MPSQVGLLEESVADCKAAVAYVQCHPPNGGYTENALAVKIAAEADIQVHDPLGYSSDHLKRQRTLTRRQPNFARISDRVQRNEIDFNILQKLTANLGGTCLAT